MKRYSGKFTLRLSAVLHQRLATLAFERGVSLNRLAVDLLDTQVLILLRERFERQIDPPADTAPTPGRR